MLMHGGHRKIFGYKGIDKAAPTLIIFAGKVSELTFALGHRVSTEIFFLEKCNSLSAGLHFSMNEVYQV